MHWHLAKAGRGSVRDAMTLLDQAISHGQGSVTTGNVIEMLGTRESRGSYIAK